MNPRAELHPDLLAFLQRGLSLYMGSTDASGGPQVARALAIRPLPGPQLALAVPAEPAAGLLAAIGSTGQVALVLCQPSTHFTVQIKGRDACVEPLPAEQWPELRRNRDAFSAEILGFGFDSDFTDAWFSVAGNGPEALRLVRFTPSGAWNQTPGPGAGAPMEWLA
jgi:hypothetical protein